jgi:DNA-directed RNA polymerase specialized sigma24 family protein
MFNGSSSRRRPASASSHIRSMADSEPLYHRICEAVDALPDCQRMVVLLVEVEGLDYREASDVLGIPVSALSGRLASARATIGQYFLTNEAKASTGAKVRE